jgi:hypothetical protein
MRIKKLPALGLMQCSGEFNLSEMLSAMSLHLLNNFVQLGQIDATHYDLITNQITCLHTFARRIQHLKPSAMEFAYLKMIAFTLNDLPPSGGQNMAPGQQNGGHQPVSNATHHSHHHHNSMIAALSRQLNSQACHELFDHILAQTPSEPSPSALSSSSGFASLVGCQLLIPHDDNQSENGSATTNTSVAQNQAAPPSNHQHQSALSQLLSCHSGGNVSVGRLMATLERYTQLMQLFPLLRWFRTDLIVELFFSGLIGNLSFDAVMPFILSMDVPTIFNSASVTVADAVSTDNGTSEQVDVTQE